MDVEGQLRRLRKTVEEQQSEVTRLSSELGQQSRVMKVFDETLQQTAQQSFTLEHRLSNLEHERETGSRSTRNAFESLGARVTELGVEVAELPTLKEMQATWQQLAQSVENCEKLLRSEHQEALNCLSSRMEAALGNLQQDTSMCYENLNHCRQDVTSLQRQIWEDPPDFSSPPERPPERPDRVTLQAASEPVTAMPSPLAPLAPRPATTTPTPLVKRLRTAEERLNGLDDRNEGLLRQIYLKANQKDFEELQKIVAGKSEKGHTHDCLISADGSVTFSL